MRPEKLALAREYLERLNGSPFFIAVDYTGLNVLQFSELRRRLAGAGAEVHVVKNNVFRLAAKDAGLPDLRERLAGQLAVVHGQRDISATAKVVKTFHGEFEKPKMLFGFLGDEEFDDAALHTLADLPPMDVLRGKLLGTLVAPATNLVRLLGTPATQLARVLQARAEKNQA